MKKPEISNCHSHTHFCDGTKNVEDYLESAVEKGMSVYGISSHNPLPNNAAWGMHKDDFNSYLQEIENAQKKYENRIQVLKGMEIDYFQNIEKPNQWIDSLDYWIGSIHFIDWFSESGEAWEIDGQHKVFQKGFQEIFSSDIQKVLSRYFELSIEMIENWKPPILGHLDKIKMHNKSLHYFDEHEEWYLKMVFDLLESAKSNDIVIEVNTRSIYKGISDEPYPSYHILKMIKELEIPVMINSDSHHPREIANNFFEVIEKLKSIGFKEYQILDKNGFRSVGII